MKFRHNNIPYESDGLGLEAAEEIARSAAYNRDAARITLELLGFEPERVFAPRNAETALETPTAEYIEHSGFTLEH